MSTSSSNTIRHRAEPVTGKGATVAEEKIKLQTLKAYESDEGHFSLVRNFRLADAITIMNAICGVSSIFFSLHYTSLTANLPTPPAEIPGAMRAIYFAIVLPIAGFGFDAADGRVARWMGGGSLLGQELDSLADLISFGVAPAVLAYTLGLSTPLDSLSLLLFTSCGLARLARFNATVALIPTKSSGSPKYFTGLPIPSSLGLTASMGWLVRSGAYKGSKGWVREGVADTAKGLGKLAAKVGAGSAKEVADKVVSAVGKTDVPFGVVQLFGQKGGFGDIHVLSFVFLAWGAAMVSKTLRVPKL